MTLEKKEIACSITSSEISRKNYIIGAFLILKFKNFTVFIKVLSIKV